MGLVSSDLIHSHLKEPKVEKIFGLLETDVEVQNCLRMANVMAVERRVGGARIFSHDEEIGCLSVEAGAAKVADGTDMAGGRARIPYKTGKVDIHSLSALSITKVEIEAGERKPVQILVKMTNPAGVFQIEEVLERKISTSGIQDLVEVIALKKGIRIKRTETA